MIDPSVPPAARHGLRNWLLAGLVVLATLAAYFPSLSGRLIWNDADYVTKPALRSFSGLGQIWTTPGATEQYYPLLHSAFWVQARLWGDDPLGYRVVNLCLHAGAAVLFALVLSRLAIPGAWLAALLFALHPVHAQSVAWIAEQKNTLSLVFYLAATLAYLRFDETRRPRAWLVAAGLFGLSLLCKTVTATLPAALLVVLWWKRGRLEWRRDVMSLLPWFVLAAAAALFATWVEQHYLGARGENFDLPALDRLLVAGRVVWIYLGHLVWPAELNFLYFRWEVNAADWRQWLFPLTVMGLAAGLWAVRQRTRAPLAVFLLFIGSLFPVLGFVNLYGALYSWVWDHWQYLPDLAPLALIAATLSRVGELLPIHWRKLGPVAAGLLVILLGALTLRHTAFFRDEETLYRLTLARNPTAWMAHNNLGFVLMGQRGREAEALAHYEEALRIRPDHVSTRVNLANLLATLPGRQGEALAQYREALQFNSHYAEAHAGLAALLATLPGGETEALVHYAEALRLRPDHVVTHNNLAQLLARLPGRQEEAIVHYQTALRIDPGFAMAHNNLANLLTQLPGRQPEALAHYEAALQLDPDQPVVQCNLANLLAQTPGRQADAEVRYVTALRLKPDYAEAHFNYAIFLGAQPARNSEAVQHYETAVRLRPDYAEARLALVQQLLRTPGREDEVVAQGEALLLQQPDLAPAHYCVAVAHARRGRIGPAIAHFSRVVELAPENESARRALTYLQGLKQP